MVEHRTNGGTGAHHGLSSPASTLDPSERQVLQALAIGLNTVEAAERLGLSVDAARDCARSAIEKLGARSKIEAVIIALRRRLIELPPA
jgi:DNA-binding NarL/FixJ family response regulator